MLDIKATFNVYFRGFQYISGLDWDMFLCLNKVLNSTRWCEIHTLHVNSLLLNLEF